MATKSLFKILNLIYLFPHRPQKNGKLKGFHLNGDQVPSQNTQPNLFVSTKVTKETVKFGQNCEIWSKLNKLGRNSDIWSKFRNLV